MASAAELLQEMEELSKEDTFEVPVGKDKIIFRRPADATESYRIRQDADRKVRMIQKSPSPVYKPYSGYPSDIIRQACWLHALASEPPFTLVEALEMGRHGVALQYLHQAIVQGIGEAIIQGEVDIIDDAKNE